MQTKLRFAFGDKPAGELLRDCALYPRLCDMVLAKGYDREEESERLATLLVAELQTKISLFYMVYKGTLPESELTARGVTMSFGDEVSRLRARAKICALLAKLDTDKIGGSTRLADLYHELRLEVDKCIETGDSFISSDHFWRTFFEFYDAYTAGG